MNMQAIPSPRHLMSHMSYDMVPGGPPAQSPAKYIYVARNPKDVAVSMYYFTKSIKVFNYDGDWNDFFEKFYQGEVVYNSWFDHVLSWWKHKGMYIDQNVQMCILNYQVLTHMYTCRCRQYSLFEV